MKNVYLMVPSIQLLKNYMKLEELVTGIKKIKIIKKKNKNITTYLS